MTADALIRWLALNRYVILVGQDVQGRRMAWVPTQTGRPVLCDALRQILASRRFAMAAVLDEHDSARCGTTRLETLAWSRTLLRDLQVTS